MKHNGLISRLSEIGINLHKSRLEFLAMLMLGMIEAKTVNLKKVVSTMQSWAQEDSVYRRAQRFFAEIELDALLFTRMMVKLIGKTRFVLCIDRTNWKFGRLNINILMIAVADKGIAIPLAFVLLEKQGNSNTLERTDLLEQVLKVIKPEQIEVFLADREFIGQDWFKFLLAKNIPFAIRIKKNAVLEGFCHVAALFRELKVGEKKYLKNRYLIYGCELAVAATRSADGQLVIIVTNRKPAWALKAYVRRWEIESLFKALKSSGFNLEDTHLTDIDRISTLVAVVSLAFLWALKVGHWLHKRKPIRVLAHGRPARSIFRLGLDFIRRAITNLALDSKLLDRALAKLSCT